MNIRFTILFFLITVTTFSQTVVLTEYDSYISHPRVNEIVVKKGNLYGLISKDTSLLIEPKYDSLIVVHFFGIYKAYKGGRLGLVNKNDKLLLPIEYCQIQETLAEIDSLGDEFIVQKDELFGTVAISDNGFRNVIELKYHNISGWYCGGSDNHYVVLNGKYGVVSLKGKIIIPPVYNSIKETYKGYIVQKGNKIGFINSNNTTVIPISQELIFADYPYLILKPSDTLNEKLVVKKNGEWNYYSFEGDLIQENIKEEMVKSDNEIIFIRPDMMTPYAEGMMKKENCP